MIKKDSSSRFNFHPNGVVIILFSTMVLSLGFFVQSNVYAEQVSPQIKYISPTADEVCQNGQCSLKIHAFDKYQVNGNWVNGVPSDFINISESTNGEVTITTPSGQMTLLPYIIYNGVAHDVADIQPTLKSVNSNFNFDSNFKKVVLNDYTAGYKWDITTGATIDGIQAIGFKITSKTAPDIFLDSFDLVYNGFEVIHNETDLYITESTITGNSTKNYQITKTVLDPTLVFSNTTEGCNGNLNIYDKIVVQSGGVLQICSRTSSTTGLLNYSFSTTGNFTVEQGGKVDGFGRGFRGGDVTTQGEGYTGLGASSNNNPNGNGGGAGGGGGACGGGGGGSGGVGGDAKTNCGNGGLGGVATSNTSTRLNSDGSYNITIGGGAGGSANAGSNGGALLIINASYVVIYGTIDLSGQTGNLGALNTGGAGAGGQLLIDTGTLLIGSTANITSSGGNTLDSGGNEGGSGAGGVLKFFYQTLGLNHSSAKYNVSAGSVCEINCRGDSGRNGVAYWVKLNSAPTINSISPVDLFSTSDTSPNFTVNATDSDGDTLNSTLFIDNLKIATITNMTSNIEYEETSSELSIGQHTWYFEVWDNQTDAGKVNSSTRTITVSQFREFTFIWNNNTQSVFFNKSFDSLFLNVSSAKITTLLSTISTQTILPSSNLLYDLGSSSFRWLSVFAQNVNATGHVNATRIFENSNRFPQPTSCSGTNKINMFGSDGTFGCAEDRAGNTIVTKLCSSTNCTVDGISNGYNITVWAKGIYTGNSNPQNITMYENTTTADQNAVDLQQAADTDSFALIHYMTADSSNDVTYKVNNTGGTISNVKIMIQVAR